MVLLPANFRRNPPVTAIELQGWFGESGPKLPHDYVEFLTLSNGGGGFVRPDLYLFLWPLRDVARMNVAYSAATFLPGFLLIGSSGGGDAIALNLGSAETGVVRVPFVGMSPRLVAQVASNFAALLPPQAEESSLLPAAREDTFGKEIVEITPILFGGNPTDPGNKAILNRDEHINYARFWNSKVRQLRPDW